MSIKWKRNLCVLLCLSYGIASLEAGKPKVWIFSDGADKKLKRASGKHITDPDDISALANYLLMSNHFDTRGIVMGGNHNANQEQRKISMKGWAKELFGKAYQKDLPNLNKHIGGYQKQMPFFESFIWALPEKYMPGEKYLSIQKYASTQALFNELNASEEVIYVLCWGTLTEPAILINHCFTTGREDILKKAVFISHWTSSYFHVGSMNNPDHVHNAFNDAKAAAYVKRKALEGDVTFYECAAIGQAGIVEGSPKGRKFYQQFEVSAPGEVYAEGKYAKKHQTVDDSDSATHWVLLGEHGVSLKDISSDGTNTPETEKRNEKAFFNVSKNIRAELLRRAQLAGKD